MVVGFLLYFKISPLILEYTLDQMVLGFPYSNFKLRDIFLH